MPRVDTTVDIKNVGGRWLQSAVNDVCATYAVGQRIVVESTGGN